MLLGAENRLRRATPADAPVAAAIIAAALAEYGLRFDPEGRDADVGLFGTRSDHDDFVVETARGAVGVASVGPHGDEGVAWVSKIFVAKEARRAGVGRALLRAVHDAARARGCRRIDLRTRVVFREAIALYESSGYALVAGDPSLLETGDLLYSRSV